MDRQGALLTKSHLTGNVYSVALAQAVCTVYLTLDSQSQTDLVPTLEE